MDLFGNQQYESPMGLFGHPLGSKSSRKRDAKRYRNEPGLMPKKEQGRNEICECGSGLKYKNCCGKRI